MLKSDVGGQARMALFLTMCFLFFINLLRLKHVEPNTGIGNAEFGTLQCESVKQRLREIDFCVSKGAQYFCTYLSSRLELFSPDQQKPLENCLSEQESRVACREGKHLCKDGIAAISSPSISPGLNPRARVSQCLESTSALRLGELCFFNGVPYVCTDIKPEILSTTVDPSPQCIDHLAANIACSDGAFLCQKSSIESDNVGGWVQYIH
jgi:hypothetical protein